MNDDEDLPRGRRDRAEFQRQILRSGRIGRHQGRPTRTFHVNFRGVKIGDPGARGGAIDYVTRTGDYAGHDDLEHLAGDSDGLAQALTAIEATAKVRHGRTAERVAIATVMEIPDNADAAGRRALAEKVVRYWQDLGHQVIAAVHAPEGNHHLHVLASSRPVHWGRGGPEVDRITTPPLRGKATVQAARRNMARIVNDTLDPAIRFFPGRDRDMDRPGIVGRDPERRVPERQWHMIGQRRRDPAAIALIRQAKAEARKRTAAEKLMVPGRRKAAALARAERAGVPVLQSEHRLHDHSMRQIVSSERLHEIKMAAIRLGKSTAQPKPLPALTPAQIDTVTGIHSRLGLELDPAWAETAEGRAGAWGVVRAAQATANLGLEAIRQPPRSPKGGQDKGM